jgi:hypothetical protein
MPVMASILCVVLLSWPDALDEISSTANTPGFDSLHFFSLAA